MADISSQIWAIQQAVRGEEVRDALVSGLNAMNDSIVPSARAAIAEAAESGEFIGPQGPQGAAGNDGVSPGVVITNIAGGHRVTITDAAHPAGQSFDVLDGGGSGDMLAETYDSDSTVASAGGIAAYVQSVFNTIVDGNGVSY